MFTILIITDILWELHVSISKPGFIQCDQIWRIYATLAIKKCAFSIWQNFELILANFVCHWANFNCCKWPNIDQNNLSSGRTGLSLIVCNMRRLCICVGTLEVHQEAIQKLMLSIQRTLTVSGEYDCTTSLQFDWSWFYKTRRNVAISCQPSSLTSPICDFRSRV